MSWVVTIVIAIQLGFVVFLISDFGAAEAATLLFVVTTALVGLLTANRVRNNPIGWLLLSAALSFATGALSFTVIESQAIDPQSPLYLVAVLVSNLGFGIGFGLVTIYVLLLFPTGRLPSSRWRIVGWIGGFGLVLLLASIAFDPGTFDGLPVENPIGLRDSEALALILDGGALLLVVPAIFASAASMVVRFQRANPVERQQLKWVVLSVVVWVAALVVTGLAELSEDTENAITTIAASLVPLAIGIAIQRYRLYDLDRIISRTVTYGLVTAALAVVYVAVVFVLTNLIRLEGDLAVAAATLGVAALFRPLRRHLQALIDRRFNRSGQTAVRTVESFTARLPSKVNLIELTGDVRTVVGQTMQPATLSMWLRGEPMSRQP
ncbi:hypothetical protein BH18ACT6_BH18ACT6_21010 [soil metagenome]